VSVQKLADGRYRIFIDAGRDGAGKRVRHTIVVKGTRKEAERKERELLRARDLGTYVDPRAGTVAEFMDRWLESAKARVAERTWVRYEQMVRQQIVPVLGQIKLADLRPLHVEAAEAEWLRSGNRRTKAPSPLGPQSVLHLHRCLHTSLERAVRWRLIAVNPVEGVDPPHVPEQEAQVLLPEEGGRLIEAVHGTEFELPILVGLYCGLRPTEYLALRWRDVDLERGELRIVQNVHRVRNDRLTRHMGQEVSGFRFGPTKTHRSRRPVAVPSELMACLALWKPAQTEERLRAGPAWLDLDLVFTDPVGRPHAIQRVERAFADVLGNANLPKVRLYDLRHTMATLMLYQGEQLKLVAARLGHANETMVLRKYGHLLPGMDRDAAERLGTLLGRRGTQMAHEGGEGTNG
jgi:integrase